MKKMKLLYCLMGLAGIAFSCSASAHGFSHGHGGVHGSVGFYFGAPYPYYPYYASPYYYPYPYTPTVIIPAPAQPQVYIQQDGQPQIQQQSQSPQSGYYWYHCDNPDGYYPYIKECPNGWQKVSPTPPAPQQ